jgi:hypothetical protein
MSNPSEEKRTFDQYGRDFCFPNELSFDKNNHFLVIYAPFIAEQFPPVPLNMV